jgi:regulator of chromosome condensation
MESLISHNIRYFYHLYIGMGHSGELARSRVMTELTSDEQNPGKMKYDLGKDFFTTVKKVFDQETKKSFEKLVPIRGKIKEHFLTPKPVLWSTPGKRQVISIGCGGFHLIVVAREPGHFETTVWTSGLNQYGQLGLGDTERRDELTLVKALDGKQIIAVDGGNHHSIAMDIHRQQIYAWGRADYGQLGLFADEQEFGEFVTTPRSVPLPDTFDMATERLEEISTGELCSYATTTAGNLYSWGFNESKQTGHKGEGDVQRPRLLKPLERGAKKFKTKTHQISGGSQHSLLVATKYLG